MDLVHFRAVRKSLVAIILNILKCVFYSRSISSAGVLTPLTILYTVRNYIKPKNIENGIAMCTIQPLLSNIFRPSSRQ